MSVDCKEAWKRQESAKIPLRLNKIKTRKFVFENGFRGEKRQWKMNHDKVKSRQMGTKKRGTCNKNKSRIIEYLFG